MGANVKKLIIYKMGIDAIPKGGGIGHGLAFLSNKDAIIAGSRNASKWVESAIKAVREACEPNPYKNADDEEIAGEILRQIEAKKKQR